MPTAGPNSWGTSADNGGGAIIWTFTGSPGTPQNSIPGSTVSNYLDLTNFGFALGAVGILGIQASLTFSVTGIGGVQDNSVKLIKGGSIVGTDHSAGADWGSGANTYGNTTSDLWGVSWSAADINSSNFGIAV